MPTPQKHGHARNKTVGVTPEYRTWTAMKSRCHSPTNDTYATYGGRGIAVCQRWRDSFEAFLADMGPRPIGASLDRIDGTGNYEPGNCRWATQVVQQNNRSNNVRVRYRGEEVTLKEVARRTGVKYRRLWENFRNAGLSLEEAIAVASNPPGHAARPREGGRFVSWHSRTPSLEGERMPPCPART